MNNWNLLPPEEGEFLGVGTLIPSGETFEGIVLWDDESNCFTAKQNGNVINLKKWKHKE